MTLFDECFGEADQKGCGVAALSSSVAPVLEQFRQSLSEAGKKIIKNIKKLPQTGAGVRRKRKVKKKQHGNGVRKQRGGGGGGRRSQVGAGRRSTKRSQVGRGKKKRKVKKAKI